MNTYEATVQARDKEALTFEVRAVSMGMAARAVVNRYEYRTRSNSPVLDVHLERKEA